MVAHENGALNLSPRERALQKAGFEIIALGTENIVRRFCKVSELNPILRHRLKRLGALPTDEIAISLTDKHDLLSACVLSRDIFIDHVASSPAGQALLFGFGIEV